MSEQGRTDIAEVSAWHTYDEVICFSLLFHAGIGIEIVESLRQETRHVDAVRRGEFHVLIQFGIHKGILDEGLTIVEHTVNLNSSDVLSQCGELALLNRRDLTLGIEHIHMDAVNPQETISNGRAGITAGSHKDIDLLIALLLTDKILQQASHETGTHILEGEGRTMKQFEGIDIFLYLNHRAVERQGVIHDVVECVRIHIFAKECAGYGVGYLLKTHLLDIIEEFLWQFVDALWHIESAIFCETFHHCFVQISYGSFPVSAIIFHIFNNLHCS